MYNYVHPAITKLLANASTLILKACFDHHPSSQGHPRIGLTHRWHFLSLQINARPQGQYNLIFCHISEETIPFNSQINSQEKALG